MHQIVSSVCSALIDWMWILLSVLIKPIKMTINNFER